MTIFSGQRWMSREQELINNLRESLSVEVKQWISPNTAEGIAKIAKASLALRNYGGGYLVIGFVDGSLKPDEANAPPHVQDEFNHDKIQSIISKYASEPFEISVSFPTKDGQVYPVIEVPPGVKTPVAAKADLFNGERSLLKTDDVYVRTLRANNTPSTSKAGWKDWSKVVEVCFDNREADIARFFRRHLTTDNLSSFHELLGGLIQGKEPEPNAEQVAQAFLETGFTRFKYAVSQRKLESYKLGFWEVALVINGQIKEFPSKADFLNLIDSVNPDYTGWPAWFDSRGFHDKNFRPYVMNGGWEALLVSIESNWNDHYDFHVFDPSGRFYLLRGFQDDLSRSDFAPEPLTSLDFVLQVIRVAEVLAVGTVFAKSIALDPEKAMATFAFRWNHLKNRELTSWTNPERYISPGRIAHQDSVESTVTIPANVAHSSLAPYVSKTLKPLFEIFNGFDLSSSVYEDLTKRLIERRL